MNTNDNRAFRTPNTADDSAFTDSSIGSNLVSSASAHTSLPQMRRSLSLFAVNARAVRSAPHARGGKIGIKFFVIVYLALILPCLLLIGISSLPKISDSGTTHKSGSSHPPSSVVVSSDNHNGNGIKKYETKDILTAVLIIILFIAPLVLGIIAVPWIGFSIYRHYKEKREIKALYETEGPPIKTQDFTFERAVGGCCYAAQQISELDEKFTEIDADMKAMQAKAGFSDSLYNRGDYTPNKNYPDREKDKQYRAYSRATRLFPIFSIISLIPFFLLSVSLALLLAKSMPYLFAVLFLFLMLLPPLAMFYYFYRVTPSKAIIKEHKSHPWHFNIQPIGSAMYLIQEDANNNLEETHRLYYDLYLPCKRKADELIGDKTNREGELYKNYREIVVLGEYLRGCTPCGRVQILQKQMQINSLKRAAVFGLVTTGVVAGAVLGFSKMVNNAGNGMGSGFGRKDT